jgi:metal-sulfur cluster biosynthetic enzyme
MKTTRVSEQEVLQLLCQVIDPEIGCNIVDLGLVYKIEIDGGAVVVTMTLTTPGCPMHDSIAAGVQYAVESLPGVESALVNIVWEPPWDPSMMTPLGREHLGVTL